MNKKTGMWDDFFKDSSSLCENYSSNITEININRNADQLLFFWGSLNFKFLEVLMAMLLSVIVSLLYLLLSKLYFSSAEI